MPSSSEALSSQLETNRRKVDVDYFDFSIREIIRLATERELIIAPEYQRKFRWSPHDESKLIESLFMGLPVPSIFVATNKDGTWEVVDGLQRVSTILHFAGASKEVLEMIGRPSPLVVGGLEKLEGLNDKTYSDLSTQHQFAFMKRMLRVTALSDKAEPEVRFDMFERLNAGGINLTQQEIRSAVYRNDFMKLVEELTEDLDFNSLLKRKKNETDDGSDEEMIIKMFAYLDHRSVFNGNVKGFLNEFMEHKSSEYSISESKDLFNKVISMLKEVIQGKIVRKKVSWTPVSLLEAILVGGAELVRSGTTHFHPKQGWLEDAELKEYTSSGSNSRAMLNGRINRAKDLLLGADVKEKFVRPAN